MTGKPTPPRVLRLRIGWRRITVKLVGENLRRYHIRTRSGYRPKLVRAGVEITQTP